MSDLVGGLYPKVKHENAPDYVIGKLSINIPQFREWIAQYLRNNPVVEADDDTKWLKVDLKVSKKGSGYASLDTWKPGDKPAEEPAPKKAEPSKDFDDGEIPFNQEAA